MPEYLLDYPNYIKAYYKARNLKWPTFKEAMQWAITEYAEVTELDLARTDGWVRNNPEDHEGFSKDRLAEELGDVIFMLMVAGIVEGVDPFQAMIAKMERKWPKSAVPEMNDEWIQETFWASNVEVIEDDDDVT